MSSVADAARSTARATLEGADAADDRGAILNGLAQRVATIASREWISLGVLALEAAERAREAHDTNAENYYVALARKCDACADQVWLAARRAP